MNSIGGYFVEKISDGSCFKGNIIEGKKFRISILTERLVRFEYSDSGKFEDRPTQKVIFRNFPKTDFTVTQTENLLQIITSYFTILYDKEKTFVGSKIAPGSNLKVNLNNSDRVWYYGHPEARNYGTINYSLDDFKGKLKLSKGLYSTDGFAVIDDSDSLVLNENGTYSSRESKVVDLYLFMYRKELGLCLKDYFLLTGYPQMVPRYALGNWWYKDREYNNFNINKFTKKIKEEEIPFSVFMLGNKWHTFDDPFNFNSNVINNIELKNTLTSNNIKLGVTINPSLTIKQGSLSYQNFNSVLGINGDINFLPINNNKLNIYSQYVIGQLVNQGVDIFYIDYNNIKDNNTLAIFNNYHYAYDELKFNRRAITLTRNHNVSIHRYGIIFTGKTLVDWNTLSILPQYNASASNMGISYVASPIGGYYKGIEDFELYIRYIQLGVFSSIMILASDDGKYYRREPWRWNISQKEIIKKYLCLRNKLIPYIYTEAYVYHKSGSPIIQPLYYQYPKIYDEPLYANQYFFGSQMLVCPITKKKNTMLNRVVQRMFIPEGIWYEFDSGKKYLGNKYYMSFYRDEDYPVFCRAGSIIVMSLDKDTNNPINLEVDVFPGADGSYKLYEDDGVSNNFKNGSFAFTDYIFNCSKEKVELTIKPNGNVGLIPDIRNYKIRFRNTNSASITVSDGSNNIPATAMLEGNDLIVDIPNVSSGKSLIISCTGSNLENSTIRLINDDIKGILEDLEIETLLKEKIDSILFNDLPIRKKRIEIRKLKRKGLEPKFIKMFINLLEYIETV